MFINSIWLPPVLQIYIDREYEGAIKNGQSRETAIIGYTRNKTKANKTKTQHY